MTATTTAAKASASNQSQREAMGGALATLFSGVGISGLAQAIYERELTTETGLQIGFGAIALGFAGKFVSGMIAEKKKANAPLIGMCVAFPIIFAGFDLNKKGMFSLSNGFASRAEYVEFQNAAVKEKSSSVEMVATPMQGNCKGARFEQDGSEFVMKALLGCSPKP